MSEHQHRSCTFRPTTITILFIAAAGTAACLAPRRAAANGVVGFGLQVGGGIPAFPAYPVVPAYPAPLVYVAPPPIVATAPSLLVPVYPAPAFGPRVGLAFGLGVVNRPAFRPPVIAGSRPWIYRRPWW